MKRIGLVAVISLLLFSAACSSGTPAPAAKTATPVPPAATATTAPAATNTPAPSAATPTQAGQPAKTATAPAAQPTAPSAAGALVTKGPLHGNIVTDTVWTRAGSPYVADGSVLVVAPATLTIEPGVEVRFTQNTALQVRGALKALGTVSQPITLTAESANPYKGWWGGVAVLGKGAKADLDYVTVRWGGYGRDGSVEAQSESVITVNHSTISDGGADGVHSSDRAVVHASNSQITGNTDSAVRYDDGSVVPQLSALTIKGNGNNSVGFGHGALTGNRTWKNLGVPYAMYGSQEVPMGSTLTIEPGVEVRFAQNTAMQVRGMLKAVGTASLPITLTAESASPYKGWWGGVAVLGKGASADLDYVTVRWGGYGRDGSVEAQSESVINVNHGVISDGGADGVHASDRAVVHVSNSQITGNNDSALRYDDGSVAPQLSALTITGNGHDAIAFGNGNLTGNRIWKNLGVPFVFYGSQEVPAAATLTVEPGVEVRFVQNIALQVRGTLNAVGTASQPIRFTAEGNSPYRGWWGGILLIGSAASANLDYATVRYGGYSRDGSIELQDGAKATIAHSTIRDSSVAGIHVVTKGSNVTVSNSQIIDNDEEGIRNGTPTSPVNAASNWWGSPTGPTADDNPGGTGSGVTAGVTYKPFLTAAP